MIKRNNKNIKKIYTKGVALKSVYKGNILVWTTEQGSGQESNSCFGSGYWINSLPWLNGDAWKNS